MRSWKGTLRFFALTVGLIADPSAAQLSPSGNQFWHQGSPGILGAVEAGDKVGIALAAGDFDNDGFGDLAIGVSWEDVGAITDAGAVQVLYGTAAGLAATGNQLWHQDNGTLLDQAEADDFFGTALAAGDFDGDGFDDLAIGVPREDLGAIANTGAVQVLYGTLNGLLATGNQFWHQDSPGMLDVAEADDLFGSALFAGDFDNDGFDDLAIGVTLEDVGAVTNAGAVHILYGTPSGLAAAGNQFWHQDSPGVIGAAEASDRFGGSLAGGDFDNDDLGDLAVGVSGEDIGAVTDAGAVQILYGTPTGLSATGNQVWHQDSPGIVGVAEADDLFGNAVATGDFDNDGFADLAIGIRGEDVGALQGAGSVQILRGTAAGLSATGNQLFSQDSPGMLDMAEPGDGFGRALTSGDFDNNGFADLAVGVDEDVGTIGGAGAVQALYGTAAGLEVSGNQFWHQDSPGVLDAAETADKFSWSLAAGDFDNDGFDDLAIGIIDEDVGAIADAGAFQILYGVEGLIFTDGFESGDTSAWSASVP